MQSRPNNNPWDYPETLDEFIEDVQHFRNYWFRRRHVRIWV